ncbi:MAG: DUF3618 domain-containing protein [Cyanobacteria bacterium]|nr:DUF3618 domain-containing protein [Cyanobacteriota bacterium]
MAQERNEMNASNSETDEIRGEIERTRVEMKETIGEIQDRLRPDHLIQQAKDGVREAATGKVKNIMSSASETAYGAARTARGYGNHLAWYAQEHPIRIAITAGVITWLVLRSRNSGSDQYYGASDTSWDRDDDYMPGEPTLRDRARVAASSARETVGEYASTARETASEYAASARDTARSASRRVASATSSAAAATNDWAAENPLAAGAVAVAVGALVGLAVRSTEYEDRTMGPARDQALQKAKDAASNLRQNVTEKVTTYAETVVGETLTTAVTEPPMGRA